MGLGLATIGMVTGIVIGTMLVNYAVKSPTISIALDNRTSPEEDLDIDHHLPKPGDAPMDEWNGMTPVTGAAVFIGVSLVTGIVLHETFRRVFHVIGSDFFDKFPLFPFAIVGGVLAQIAAVRYKFEWAVNRRAVEGLGTVRTPANRFAIAGAQIHFRQGAGTHAGRFAALLAVSRIGETYRELVRKGRLSPVWHELPKDASRAQRTGTASPVSDRNRRGADACQERGLQVSNCRRASSRAIPYRSWIFPTSCSVRPCI